MPAYDPDLFDPPAPLARVTLRPIDSHKTIIVPMLIDSGSDLTLIPEAAVTELGSETSSSQRIDLEAFDGSVSQAVSVELDLIFLGVTFRGYLPVVKSQVGVLGRNVLNRFPILLDGPRLGWEHVKTFHK